ncbi:hypothetical protein [Achromobacter spanius]|uniref:hypothetical protein n=1 Tax=Achromobacter spanius TaxID=217203 RepID=UPI00131A3317|nr:hypothetical protein [Achromobacter spanius]
MGIRSNNNRKSRQPGRGKSELDGSSIDLRTLTFWTAHPQKKAFVDLNEFYYGQGIRNTALWNGGFTGRPELLLEMLPAIHDRMIPLSHASIQHYIGSFRQWWRVFDSVEAELGESFIVRSAADVTEVHWQRILDVKIERSHFGLFLSLINEIRVAKGLRRLHWQGPQLREPRRHLAPKEHIDAVRHRLRRSWFGAIERWELADAILSNGSPLVSEQEAPDVFAAQARILEGRKRFSHAIANGSPACVTREYLRYPNEKLYVLYHQGHTVEEILESVYPGDNDIRAAFHLCLATTGWNPSVLLDLDATSDLVEAHPTDNTRFIIRAAKARAPGVEQIAEGLFKSRGAIAFIISYLISRTEPLRQQLRDELKLLRQQVRNESDIASEKRIVALESGVKSVWIYCCRGNIHWLNVHNFAAGYLVQIIDGINEKRPMGQKIARFPATDFRDAYAAFVYHSSGGSILAVMRALNHSRIQSTTAYLNNSLLLEEHRHLYRTFSQAMWRQISENTQVDPTILAIWSRFGPPSKEAIDRLYEYRNLVRSRIGVGCKDPYHPPSHVDPNFKSDGSEVCVVQRCLLCVEHAVIFPDSLSGLCKRKVEIDYIKENMGQAAFTQSSFQLEANNVELVLLGFEKDRVEAGLEEWRLKIASGEHKVAQFDGIQGVQ